MDEIPKKATGLVGDILVKQDKRGTKDLYIKEFQLENVLTRKTEVGTLLECHGVWAFCRSFDQPNV